MNFLGNVDAVIFDLRNNDGGEPRMLAVLSTYLFSEPTHLNDLYNRNISNESGTREVYVKKFFPEPDGGASAVAGKWIVSRGGSAGMIHWRKDGKELYYLSADSKVMAVDVTTTSDFHSGTPKPLFALSQAFLRRSNTPGNLADIASDGKRFLFALPVEQNQPDDIKLVLNWEAGLKK